VPYIPYYIFLITNIYGILSNPNQAGVIGNVSDVAIVSAEKDGQNERNVANL